MLKNVVVRVLVTLLAVLVGLMIANGLLWLFLEIFGPFHPNSTQQDRNALHYLIGSVVVIFVSAWRLGNMMFSRYLCRRLE